MNIPENFDIDFEFELKNVSFPFNELIKQSDRLLNLLRAEFRELKSRPKPFLFIREFITEEEWNASASETHLMSRVSGSEPVAANFVAHTPTELKYYRLMDQFQEHILKHTLDRRYYGRSILETPMVMNFTEINRQIEVFKQYAIDVTSIDTFQGYAQAAAKSITRSIFKINDRELQFQLFEMLDTISINMTLAIANLTRQFSELQQREIEKRFIILKAFAGEIFHDSRSQSLQNSFPVTESTPNVPKVTVTDRMMRELDIILQLFKVQYSVYDGDHPERYPTMLGPDGHSGISGTYVQNWDILSDNELLNLQDFKQQITTRFESASNHQLLKSQLAEIKHTAMVCVDYYNQHLIDGNLIVEAFKKDHARPINERIDQMEKYHAVALIENYHILEVYLNTDRSRLYSSESFRSREPYSYIADNLFLAEVAQQVVNFISLFDIGNLSKRAGKRIPALVPDSLFKEPAEAQKYLNILKAVHPPIITSHGSYNLGDHEKSAVIAWFDILRSADKIAAGLTPEQQKDMVNAMIPGLNVSKRLFNNMGQRAYEKYRPELERLIARL